MLWAARAAAEAVRGGGARRRVPFWPRDRLRPMTSSANRTRRCADAHRGPELAGEAAQGGWRRGPSGGDGWRSWGRSVQACSKLLIPSDRLMVSPRRCYGG
jgi:hypothetical protein